MPFTIGGEWIPNSSAPSPKKPIKVCLEKRRGNIVTVIHNLPGTTQEIESFASDLKRKLGCGGSIKDGNIEVQGNKVEPIQKWLEFLKKK